VQSVSNGQEELVAVDDNQMMQAIYDALYAAIATAPPGSTPTVTSPILVVARPGLAIQPKDYTGALSVSNPTGLNSSLEAFSDLIDPAPLFNAAYTPGGSTSELYGEVVHGTAQTTPPTQAQIDAYNAAKSLVLADGKETSGVAAYNSALATYASAVQAYNGAYWAAQLTTGPGQRAWAAAGPPLLTAVKAAFGQLQQTQPNVYQGALATVSQYGASADSAIADALVTYNNASIQGVLPGTTFYPSWAYPTDWMDDTADSAYTQITIKSTSLKTSKSSNYDAYSASASASWGLFSVDASSSGKFVHNAMNSDTSDMEVDFKFARVIVTRPWLNGGIFSLNGLQVAGRSAGAFSTGAALTSNLGILPLLINSVIVVKDVKVSASWGHEDSDFISKTIDASASGGWGPFKFSGGYEHSDSNETMNSTFDGTTLTLPGFGVIGFVCTLTPLSPAIS
jgi:hypothetical protein